MKGLFIFTLLISSSAFAISDNALIARCRDKGAENILARAKAHNCSVFSEDLSVITENLLPINVDNRFYRPVKYVLYSAHAECVRAPEARIQTWVSYNSLKDECI